MEGCNAFVCSSVDGGRCWSVCWREPVELRRVALLFLSALDQEGPSHQVGAHVEPRGTREPGREPRGERPAGVPDARHGRGGLVLARSTQHPPKTKPRLAPTSV